MIPIVFERLAELVNADEHLVRGGRFLNFPMSENPAQFRRYILPVIDEIRTTP